MRQFLLFLFCVCVASTALAAGPGIRERSRSLADMSLEELLNESVTSVAKKEQRIGAAPAAIFVLTAEDILRAGHTSIPEALRMVPGLSVARLDSHTWVITARGFAAQYAGKLLVLIDGRTVYNPFFSGVFWDLQDVLLEDLDRIEVIRGPGATLWGANAVNGVINVITRHARDSQDGLAILGGGSQERGAALRYGGQIGSGQYRAYLKYDDDGELVLPEGGNARDAWHMWRAGFRSDLQATREDTLTVQGDVYGGEQNALAPLTSLTPPYMNTLPYEEGVFGANVLARWTSADAHSPWSLQVYYDLNDERNRMLAIKRHTADIEFQRQISIGSRHTMVYGAGYRYTQAEYVDSFFVDYPVEGDSAGLTNVFVQDEIVLARDRLALNVGSKLEHNPLSGFELQPSAGLLWTPDRTHSIWASVSRAARTPNPLETRARVNYAALDPDGPGAMPPTLLSLLPNSHARSEEVLAYEAGYRLQPHRNLHLDVATFLNVYEDLMTIDTSGTMFEVDPAPSHLVLASTYANRMRGRTHGVELASVWQAASWWRLAAGYTWLQMSLRSSAIGRAGEEQETDSPRNQWHVRSMMQGPRGITADAALYYVGGLPNQHVESYLRCDVRLGWNATERMTVSVGGTNLFDDRHSEFAGIFAANASAVPRTVYGKLTWRF